MNCPKCGRAVISRYKFCGFCGANIHEIPAKEDSEETFENSIDDEPVIIVSKPQENYEEQETNINNDISYENNQDESEIIIEDESENSEENQLDIVKDDSSEELDDIEIENDEDDEEIINEDTNTNEETSEPVADVASEEQEVEPLLEEADNQIIENEDSKLSNENEDTKVSNDEIVYNNLKENDIKEEPIPVVIPQKQKNRFARSGRKIVRLLSTLAFFIAFGAIILMIATNYKNVMDSIKEITDYYKVNPKVNNDNIIAYIVIGFPAFVLVISVLIGLISLFRGLVSYKKDLYDEAITISHIVYSIPVAFSFVAMLVVRTSADYKHEKIGLIMSCVALGVLVISTIVEAIRHAISTDTKKLSIFKSLFDLASTALLVIASVLMIKNFIDIKIGDSTLATFKMFDINVISSYYIASVNKDTGLALFIADVAYTLFVVLFVLTLAFQIGKKISMENAKRGIPYMPILMFILLLISFDIYSYKFEKTAYSLYTTQVIYYIILMIAVASLLYMFRQLIFDIEDKKNKNLILKRLGSTLMFAASVAMILSYIINGFTNNRLYFYNIISNISSKKTLHVVIMQIMTILFFIIGVRKILSSFADSNVEKAHSNSAYGVSLVFASFFASVFIKFTDYYDYGYAENKIKIVSSEILCIIIYCVLAALMITFALLKYKRSVKQLICSLIEVALVGTSIIFAYMFKLKTSSITAGMMAIASESKINTTSVMLALLSLVFIVVFANKLKHLLTLDEVKVSGAGLAFLAAVLYVLCWGTLMFDIYDETLMENPKDCIKDFKEMFTKINYAAPILLLVEMIIGPIFKGINKQKA